MSPNRDCGTPVRGGRERRTSWGDELPLAAALRWANGDESYPRGAQLQAGPVWHLAGA
jgi:hypothetical protein